MNRFLARRSPLFLLLAYVIGELFVFSLVSDRLGFLVAFMLAILKAFLGFALVASFARSAISQMGRGPARIIELSGSALGARLLGAFFLILPGFLSGIIGLALLTPSIFSSRSPGRRRGFDEPDVIELDETQWRELDQKRIRKARGRTGPAGSPDR
jgi:UPF0716 family protein affecting phage T7 exclusion